MAKNTLLKVALDKLGCTQTALAEMLGISRAQVSKWKNGENISPEMARRIQALIGITEDADPSLIALTGSIEDAVLWEELCLVLLSIAAENDRSGYSLSPVELEFDDNLFTFTILDALSGAGVIIPREFPNELRVGLTINQSECDFDTAFEALNNHPVSKLILDMLTTLANINGYYLTSVEAVINSLNTIKDYKVSSAIENIEAGLISLALAKTQVDRNIAPNFSSFRRATIEEYEDWLWQLKVDAVKQCVPLKNEIMSLVYEEPETLALATEDESSGLNQKPIHPDMYINELLLGMRKIQKVLPEICRKLDIAEDNLILSFDELT